MPGIFSERQTQGQASRRRMGWIVLGVLLVVLLAGGAILKRERIVDMIAHRGSWMHPLQSSLPEKAGTRTLSVSPSTSGQSNSADGVQFDFYGELPKIKTPPLPAASDAASHHQPLPQSGYMVQVGDRFSLQSEAAQMRLSLYWRGGYHNRAEEVGNRCLADSAGTFSNAGGSSCCPETVAC